MNEPLRQAWISYGPKAVLQEFGPRGALLLCEGDAAPAPAPAPAGAPFGMGKPTFVAAPVAFASPPKAIIDAAREVTPLRVIPTADRGRPQAVQVVPRDVPMGDPKWGKRVPAREAPPVGVPVGYPRAAVDACLARMRAANAYSLAAAVLRTEPFASAPQFVVGVRGGVPQYTGAVMPWDAARFERNAPWAPGERARYFIMLARHYAAGIQDGNARPLNMIPSWAERALEGIPTHDRTAAWVDAWARWAVDAIGVALNEAAAYDDVAGAVLSICQGWQPVVY